MRNADDEAQDIEEEARVWREWSGETYCLGLVAKCVLLLVVVGMHIVG